MALGRGHFALVCALAVLGGAVGPAPVQADFPRQCGSPRLGTVLYFPGGGFVLPASDADLAQACRELGRRGLAARPLRYPLRDVPGALDSARRAASAAARGKGPVFVLGDSAGGTIAAMLAQEGRVDAAVAVAAPTNLLSWNAANTTYWQDMLHMSEADRAAASPVFAAGRHGRPLLLMHSRADELVPYAQSAELAGELRDAELIDLSGGHSAVADARPRALRWLRDVATGRRAAPGGPRRPWFSRG